MAGSSTPNRDSQSGTPNLPALRRRIRVSTVLTTQQKRQWLAVLPHLSEEDRARLADILEAGDAPPRAAPPAPSEPQRDARTAAEGRKE